MKYHSYQFEQFFPIACDRTRYWLIIKTFWQKTSHFHEKSLFSVNLAPWGQSNTLKFLKNFSILLKPISKGNFILRLDGTIPIFSFSQHPILQPHLQPLSRSCFMHIRDLLRIRPMIDSKTASTIATSIVHSKLDYCNSLFLNLGSTQIQRLQLIQNSLAQAVIRTPSIIISLLSLNHFTG